jgi:hypothetical protein
MAFDWGNAFRGGATGAAAGSVFPGWGTAIGAGLGALSGLFGNDEEENTNKLLDQIPDQLKQYIMPYITAGQGALPGLQKEYGNLVSNPNDIISRIGSGYKQSPGYQWRLNQGENSINNAAAAGGMAGTAQHQQQAGELATNLASQDYNDYMTNALGLYGTGLEGEKGLATLGANSGSDLGTSLSNLLQGKAGLNYARGATKNQMNSDLFSSILQQLNTNRSAGQTDKLISALMQKRG